MRPDEEEKVENGTGNENGGENGNENGGENGGDNGNEGETPQVTGTEIVVSQIPEAYVYLYYNGDYYEAGSGNLSLAICTGEIYENEDWEFAGNGSVFFFDLNIELAENPDAVVLATGEYAMAEDESCTPGTWNPFEDYSYIVKVVDDEVIYEYAAFTAGTIEVSKEGDVYTISFEGEVDGEPVAIEYVGAVRTVNHSFEGKFTNLDKDVTVGGLVKASMANMGDLAEDGTSETWMISMGDEYYDLTTDWGLGNGLFFYVNLEPGLAVVKEGHYDVFVDMMTAETFPVNTLVAGAYYWGTYGGCWYTCPVLGYEVALNGGYLDIVKTDDGYEFSGELVDGNGKKVAFSYSGPVEQMEVELMSVKSASNKAMVSRKPSFLHR